jgi:hypothetical protein
MSTENVNLTVNLPAAEDLSNDQYRFVVRNSSGEARRPDSASEVAEGVLLDAPDAAGKGASIGVSGYAKVEAGEALAINDLVCPEYVDAADAGKAIKATYQKNVRGIVVEPADAEGDLAGIRLFDMPVAPNQLDNPITDPGDAGAIPVTKSGVCPMTSAGAETRTIAAPSFVGQQIALIDDVHVGNIVVTSATTVNQTGNNTLTFGAAADACVLTAMQVAGALVWRISFNDGVALSTV